ncbi:MAG: LexA family protein [Pseudomonas sp.]
MSSIRPTKKQYELLGFIEHFIAEHGYSPSYREIMNGLQYTSVATVSLHINNLIKRGHLVKRSHSARSLEVLTSAEGIRTGPAALPDTASQDDQESAHITWLVTVADSFLAERVRAEGDKPAAVEDRQVILRALELLGFGSHAASLQTRFGASTPKTGGA